MIQSVTKVKRSLMAFAIPLKNGIGDQNDMHVYEAFEVSTFSNMTFPLSGTVMSCQAVFQAQDNSDQAKERVL